LLFCLCAAKVAKRFVSANDYDFFLKKKDGYAALFTK